MAKKQLRPAPPCKAATGPGSVQATTPDRSEYLTSRSSFQGTIDPVAWLAARANVAASTARLFAELHGFAGCRS